MCSFAPERSKRGRGIERMCAACRAAGFPEPVLTYEETGLWVSFSFSRVYLNLIEGSGTPEVTPGVTPEVTPEVERLLAVLKAAMSRAEIMAALGLKDEKHFREQYQQTAATGGLIEMTIPDKPRSRLQKYRLTAAGLSLLQALSKRPRSQ